MKAAIVSAAGQTPTYGNFAEPQPKEGALEILVTASALSPLTKGRASGAHYSSSGKFPFIAGVDGVGRLKDGRRVYFAMPEAPFGGMAERTLARAAHCIDIPDGLDDTQAAAIANPGMSSWAALKERAKLGKGEILLVNGATGSAGSVAVQVAKYLGARKVIATGRNPEVLRSLRDLGADVLISLEQEPASLEKNFREELAKDGVDVILDYIWGPSAEALLTAATKTGKEGVPIRFIQIGTMGGADITLPGAVLRSTAIELKGSGIGSVAFPRLIECVREVLRAAQAGALHVPTQTVPLSEVEATWNKRESARVVFAIGG